MSESTPMDETEKPRIVIPLLTSKKESGEPYERPEAVDDELRSMLPLGPGKWIKAKRELKSESLAFLHRYIRHQNVLLPILHRRSLTEVGS